MYRRDRLIQAGGWCRLRTSDEHSKLARVAVDIPRGAEELFDLNISKTQVRVPDTIRSELAAIASSIVRRAQDVYRTPASALRAVPTATPDGDPRVKAINAILEMVLDAVEIVIRDELRDAGRTRHIARRLRMMQASLLGSLNAEILKADSPSSRRTQNPVSAVAGSDLDATPTVPKKAKVVLPGS